MPDTVSTPTITPTEETVTNPVTDDGDHDRFSHYARKNDVTRANGGGHTRGCDLREGLGT